MEKWYNSDAVFEVIKKAREKKWRWIKNSQCKYITLRIDMRDGHCIITDRNGNAITQENLEFQSGLEE